MRRGLAVLSSCAAMGLTPKFEVPFRMGVGLAALGRPGYINLGRGEHLAGRDEASMRARAFEVLDAAWAAGVRWFDAARSYGEAEAFLGEWLAARGVAPSDVCVSSKWGYRYNAAWQVTTAGGEPHEIKDHSLAHLLSQAEETAAALGDYVDLYQVHSATLESGVLDDGAVLGELLRLKEDRGWRVGASVSSPAQADVVLKALEAGGDDPVFDCVQVTYNVLEQSAQDALVAAAARGVDVIIKEAMANGRVLRSAPLLARATDLGVSPDALALGCVLAQPFRPHVLSGAVTTDQLASNLGAVDCARRLAGDPALLAAIMAECRQDGAAYWADRGALAWN